MITLRFIVTRLHLLIALLPLLTFKKVWNLLSAMTCFGLRTRRSVDHPPILILTLTTHCNYSCRMCLKSRKPTSIKGELLNYQEPREMDFAALRDLLTEHAEYLLMVKLHGGEPLYYSAVVQLVDLLNELKIPFFIGTNGSLLTEELCEKLVAGYCFTIGVSLDAASDETYRYMRRRGELSRVLANLQLLNQVKKRRASSRPVLSASMCTFAENVGEVSSLVEICSQYQIPSLTVAEGHDYDTPFSQPEQLAVNNKERFRQELVRARQAARRLGIILRLRFPSLAGDGATAKEPLPRQVGHVLPRDCLNLYASLWLLPDFEAIGCSNSTVRWGNIREHGLRTVWNGPGGHYACARRDLTEGRVPLACTGCIYTGSFLS